MLASLLVNEPVGIKPKKLRECTIPDCVAVKGLGAIQDYIADQVLLDARREQGTTGERPPETEMALVTVAEAAAMVRTEAIEIDNEAAIVFILAAID
jgi:hypothetical protein